MTSNLFHHLLRSRVVQRAFAKEVLLLVLYIGACLAARAAARDLQNQSLFGDTLSIVIICLALFVAWLQSVIKTVKTTLREENSRDTAAPNHITGTNSR